MEEEEAIGTQTQAPIGRTLVKPPASSSSPPQRAPSARREPSPSPAPTSWLLLDRSVHRSRRHRGVFAGDPTTSDIAYDCVGRDIRVSLRVADPPLVSRLYLHWMLRPATVRVMNPLVIAAHLHSILFKVTVPFEDPCWWHHSSSFPDDYFVYSAANTSSTSSSNMPSLTRLPPCFNYKCVPNKEDEWFQPYRYQQQRSMLDKDMLLFCHGDDGEFTVAHLRCFDEVELCVLHHSPRSFVIPTQWRDKKLPTPLALKVNYPRSLWHTDTTFPIAGYLCWVDYYHGMLLVDVHLANSDRESSPNEQELRYIPLPKLALKSRRPYEDILSPDPFRHVCVTDPVDGIVKLVCIFTKYSQSTFTIITWTLKIDKPVWIRDRSSIIGDSEFFGMFDAAQSNLPRVTPSFPVVSLADPDIICFLLKDEDKTYWVIQVNMREKVVQSSAMYIREEEEEGYSPEKPRWNFYGQYFVPSKFSSYLGQDDFKSRELSILMEEKAKQLRVMQKEARSETLLTQERAKQCQAKRKETQVKKLRKGKHKGKGRKHN